MIWLPDKENIANIADGVRTKLKQRFCIDDTSGKFKRKICACCENIHVVENPVIKMGMTEFILNVVKR